MHKTMIQQNKTVLITGPTSGIGLELAKLFAHNQFNMILVARNESRLKRTAGLLHDEGAGKITIIPKDLSIPGAPLEVYNETRKAGHLVNILVNNAGVGEYGLFKDTDISKEMALVQLNISAMIYLTKLYLKDMLSSKGGKILQLGSVAAYQPTPRLSVYAATKAFILSFSDALGTELKDKPVSVTTLVPDATDTDFFRKAGMAHTKAAHEKLADPAIVARVGYEAMMRGDAHAFPPGVTISVMMSSMLPNRRVAEMAEKHMQEEPKSVAS